MNGYESLIENEKKVSEKFLTSLQVFDERFNYEDYDLIKEIFTNSEIIDKIYYIIDDIVNSLKENYKVRFLVMSDFLFSMTSYELSDPSNIILKTSRSSYIENIKIRAKINKCIGLDSERYILIHKKLLIGLRITNILKRTKIRKLENDSWETIIYMQIIGIKIVLKSNIRIGFSEKPFIVKDIEDNIYSISSFRNIWKAKRKKREMQEFRICIKSIIKANQIKMFLSSDLIKINKEYIENERNKLFYENKCNSYEDYFNKIIDIVKDNSYILKDKKIIFNKCKDYHDMMRDFQKILSLYMLNKEILDKGIYLPCFADNRGRQYYGTLISPTFYKIFRYLYEFSNKKSINNLKESKFYSEIIKYSSLVEEFKMSEEKKYFLIVLLIEVGKFFVNAKSFFIKTEDIIISGLENYKIKNININKEEIMYLNKIYLVLDNLINYNKLIDTIIFKDATASGLQNYGLMLGYKEEMLKYINIDGSDWCDTYKYLIDKFLELDNVTLDKEKIKKRKNWKSTIMTIPYNAVWFSCFSKFLESLREEGIEYNELNDEEKKELKKIHKNFYKNIKENVKKEFYRNSKEDLIMFGYQEWKEIEKKEYKVNYKKGRDKYIDIKYIIEEDKKSSMRALEANNMHYRDSELVKEIIDEYEVITIHDCFGISLFELHNVMDKINSYYSKIIGKKTYCIHIIK